MRLLLPILLLSVILSLSCDRETTATNTATKSAPSTAAQRFTEPWKSMTLPIDGAVVDFSTKGSLGLKYVTHTQDTAAGIVGTFTEAFEAQGYMKTEDRDGESMRITRYEHPTKGIIQLNLNKDEERPFIHLHKL